MIRFSLFTCLLCLSALSYGINLPAYTALYQAEWRGGWIPVSVAAVRNFSPVDNGIWSLSFKADSIVVDLNESSDLIVKDGVLYPQFYHYKTKGMFENTKLERRFEWDSQRIFDLTSNQYWDIELQPGMQDNISYQEQLRFDLANKVDELVYPVVYRGKIKTYIFNRYQEGSLKTPNGEINTIEVHQVINQDNNIQTKMWFAVDYDYVLVRLWQKRKNGDEQEITLQRYDSGGKQINVYNELKGKNNAGKKP